MTTNKRKYHDEYELAKRFHEIEDGILELLSKKLKKGINSDDYKLWQAEQMAILSNNKFLQEEKILKQFKALNSDIENLLKATSEEAAEKEQKKILNKVKLYKAGYLKEQAEETKKEVVLNPSEKEKTGTTFILSNTASSDETQKELLNKLNDNKMNALITATLSDMEKAEHATLRRADDIYRRIIFNTETYLATTGNLKKAVDMAAHEFIANGIRSIEYKNGARVNIGSYSEMALRTANKRAYLQGEAKTREELGVNLVIVNSRSQACPMCMKFIGKVFVDDVYGAGTQAGLIQSSKYPKLSEAIEAGLYHPNCKDSHSTYYEGITTKPKLLSPAEKQEALRVYELEQKQRYNERQIRKYKRLEQYSIDEEQQKKYKAYREKWQAEQRRLIENNQELRRDYNREKIYK